jgi:hypothetical protein
MIRNVTTYCVARNNQTDKDNFQHDPRVGRSSEPQTRDTYHLDPRHVGKVALLPAHLEENREAILQHI